MQVHAGYGEAQGTQLRPLEKAILKGQGLWARLALTRQLVPALGQEGIYSSGPGNLTVLLLLCKVA